MMEDIKINLSSQHESPVCQPASQANKTFLSLTHALLLERTVHFGFKLLQTFLHIAVFHENIKTNIHLISINASKNMSVVFNKLFNILISSVLINPQPMRAKKKIPFHFLLGLGFGSQLYNLLPQYRQPAEHAYFAARSMIFLGIMLSRQLGHLCQQRVGMSQKMIPRERLNTRSAPMQQVFIYIKNLSCRNKLLIKCFRKITSQVKELWKSYFSTKLTGLGNGKCRSIFLPSEPKVSLVSGQWTSAGVEQSVPVIQVKPSRV